MRNIALVSAFVLLAAAPASAQIGDGDQHWAARATGHQGGRASATEVDAAIAAYQRAIAQYPNDLEPRWKLLRAIRFKGAYVASTNADKKTIYGMGKKAGEEAVNSQPKDCDRSRKRRRRKSLTPHAAFPAPRKLFNGMPQTGANGRWLTENSPRCVKGRPIESGAKRRSPC